MNTRFCPTHVTIDWGTPDDPGPSGTFQCQAQPGHTGEHRNAGAGTWVEGETTVYRGTVSSLPMPKQTPLDLAWARRCAADFADKPTDARARNAAQCLAGLLDAYDSAIERLTEGRLLLSPELCREVHTDPDGAEFQCFLAHRHDGDHSDNVRHREPTTWPRAATAPCTAEGWHRPGIDPCPARSHRQESCLKGYLHRGAHEWGGTKTIEAGPELPVNDCTPCSATREDSYDRKTLTCIRRANHDGRHKMRTGVESYLEWSDLALLGEPNDPDQTPKNCRCTVGPKPAAAPDEQEHRCPRCGSTSWVSVSLNQGWTRRAQCVPCGHVHAELGAGWRKEAATRPAGDATEPRTGVDGKGRALRGSQGLSGALRLLGHGSDVGVIVAYGTNHGRSITIDYKLP